MNSTRLVTAVLIGCAVTSAPLLAQDLREPDLLIVSRPEMDAFFQELFGATDVSHDDPAGHARRVVDQLAPGDKAQLLFRAYRLRPSARLYLDVSRDVHYIWVTIRSSGPTFDAATEIVRRHRRKQLIPLEGKVLVRLDEAEPPGGVVARVSLVTQREYECTGYRIEADVLESDGLQLHLLGIMPPRTTCGPAMTPAALSRDVTLRPGRYRISLHRDDVIDRYEVIVTDSTLQLVSVVSTFSEADTRIIRRHHIDAAEIPDVDRGCHSSTVPSEHCNHAISSQRDERGLTEPLQLTGRLSRCEGAGKHSYCSF